MHTPLLTKHEDETRVVGLVRLSEMTEKPFEERETAVVEPDVVQDVFLHGRGLHTLLHHSRQLLVVAYHHELAYGRQATREGREQAYQVGLQNLGGLIDDGQVETLHVEEFGV